MSGDVDKNVILTESKVWKKQRGPKTNAKKWTDQNNNPCVAEANASYRCLHDTNFDRKSCQTYFVNYQNCQKFWRRERWLQNIKREGWVPTPSSRVCSAHFVSGKPAYLHNIDHFDWAPTQKMGHSSAALGSTLAAERYIRRMQRKRKAKDVAAASALLQLSSSQEPNTKKQPAVEQTEPPVSPVMECQTDISSSDISSLEDNIKKLQEDNIALREQVRDLQEKCKQTGFHESDFEKDDSKVKFYTGLPSWHVFLPLFVLISSSLPTCRKLSKFSQLLMFLMKIRLNLFDEDLAYRFGVHQSTVSRNFHRVLDILAVKTSSFIHWPSREALRKSMPSSFRKFFQKCAVIIDCTEIFIEQPSDLLARAQVWSNYKHHSTVKFLIGITPQGSISFLSKCWGGRVSDTEITENSNLLCLLMPGDVVIADRGFFVGDYCGMAMAEVKTPPFTRGKKQLEKVEVDWSRELSCVRIHVERVIGMVKQKYTLLQNRIPITLLNGPSPDAAINKIVHVACALVNLCPSVVPNE